VNYSANPFNGTLLDRSLVDSAEQFGATFDEANGRNHPAFAFRDGESADLDFLGFADGLHPGYVDVISVTLPSGKVWLGF
jgi:hypothetical protein